MISKKEVEQRVNYLMKKFEDENDPKKIKKRNKEIAKSVRRTTKEMIGRIRNSIDDEL